MQLLRRFHFCLVVLVLSLGCVVRVAAEETESTRNVEGIMDNSFFIEEAYNQERGVVQHILNILYSFERGGVEDQHGLDFVFTQEWPVFTQKHQFSYTVPYSFANLGDDSTDGIRDMLLNYRYQAYLDEETLTAFAPRFSLILPTGDEDRGFGSDTVGYQWNLPFSTTLGDSWFVHANVGLTFRPNAGPSPRQDLVDYNVGASAIYALTKDFHLMVEWVGFWNESQDNGGTSTEFQSLISPGIRRAFNFVGGQQLVLGIAVPVGLTDETADVGVFGYVSFEHAFARTD
jgi:hypothetical protein